MNTLQLLHIQFVYSEIDGSYIVIGGLLVSEFDGFGISLFESSYLYEKC